MDYAFIIEEHRKRGDLTTLERTRVDSEGWGRFRVKTVRLKYFDTEGQAREYYQSIITPPPKKRRGRPPKEK